jgi:hypothetical protein
VCTWAKVNLSHPGGGWREIRELSSGIIHKAHVQKEYAIEMIKETRLNRVINLVPVAELTLISSDMRPYPTCHTPHTISTLKLMVYLPYILRLCILIDILAKESLIF